MSDLRPLRLAALVDGLTAAHLDGLLLTGLSNIRYLTGFSGSSALLVVTVAALLLPTLLESNAPRTYAAGLTPQRGSGERCLFVVGDDPLARWLVTIDPDKLEAQRGYGRADLTITGPAATLALLVYGRGDDLGTLGRSGAVRLEGDLALADRFALIFPRP